LDQVGVVVSGNILSFGQGWLAPAAATTAATTTTTAAEVGCAAA
jgi:hypothetical protein